MTDIDPNLILDVPDDDDGNYAAYVAIEKWNATGIKWHIYAQSSSGGVAFYFNPAADVDAAAKLIQPVTDPAELQDIDAVRVRADEARSRRSNNEKKEI